MVLGMTSKAVEPLVALSGKSIAQLVAIFGDGKLRQDSQCSLELRAHLKAAPFEKLAEYARYCLDESFEKSGCVLQDVVNEIGSRLGYQVTNGRYSGVRNAIGYDGLWFDGARYLVVEVKTTDAYRINLDTIADYIRRLRDEKSLREQDIFALIVVGRQDTGDLEAQVRGSRHAWSIRLISVEALLKLAHLNDSVDDPALVGKIRRIVLPFEYTRVDDIIDLVFETQVESGIQAVADTQANSLDSSESPEQVIEPSTPSKSEATPKALLDAKRLKIVEQFFKDRGESFTRRSKTNFEGSTSGVRVACAVSKLYQTSTPGYWYAFHPPWLQFLKEGKESYFILGCMDRDDAYALPIMEMESRLDEMNKTEDDQKMFWHVQTRTENSDVVWNLSKVGARLSLAPYRFVISNGP
jgi:hypothetical protein